MKFLIFIYFLLLTGLVFAQPTDDEIDVLREELRSNINVSTLGSGYAAMANFAIVPDISTASYHINSDTEEDTLLRVNRIPIKIFLDDYDSGNARFIQFNWVFQTTKSHFNFLPEDKITTYWKTSGPTVSYGKEYSVSKSLKLVPVIDGGILELKNNADYLSSFGTDLLQPLLAEILFDWDTKAWVVGGSLGLQYEKYFSENKLTVHTSLTHNHLETFSESSRFVEFSNSVSTFSIETELKIPTTYVLMDLPVSLITHLANTSFWGKNRSILGFDDFFEFGVSIELDVESLNLPMRNFRLGLKSIFAKEVDGWAIDLGYRF